MQTPDTLSHVKSLVAEDLKAVDALLLHALSSDVSLVGEVGHHLIESGGKRLRALLVLLIARGLGYEGTAHHHLAAVIELIHAATLLHDDVVDNSLLRRGQNTANAVFGNSASVLVGDFLYSRSFQMMVALQRLDVMQLLSDTTNTIAAGEVLQLMHLQNPGLTEADYFAIIERKTAALFEAATALGAMVSTADQSLIEKFKLFGKHFGICYQLIDDALDYSGDESVLGKQIGDDLKEGKITLPLIHALQALPDTEKSDLLNVILQCEENAFDLVTQAITASDAILYTAKFAKTQADKAKALLNNNNLYFAAIIELLDYVVEREC